MFEDVEEITNENDFYHQEYIDWEFGLLPDGFFKLYQKNQQYKIFEYED